jgi:undecaprenyl-diphosphatase
VRDAAIIGLFQCLALWPGVSRSAATIVGGMLVGRSRATAVEYSFLAAIPAIGAAAMFALVRGWSDLTAADLPVFAVGFAAAFGSAWIAVTVLLRLVQTTTLRPFAWYRLALAAVILVFM